MHSSVSLDDDVLIAVRERARREVRSAGSVLALAVRHEGRLVTFDQSVPLSAVRGAKHEHLMVL